MIDKQTYLNLKREIKLVPYTYIVDLYKDMNLDEYERGLLLDFYSGKTVVQVCMERNISAGSYTTHMKKLFTKIYNYKNTLK